MFADYAEELWRAISDDSTAPRVSFADAAQQTDIVARLRACEHFLITYQMLTLAEYDALYEANANDSNLLKLEEMNDAQLASLLPMPIDDSRHWLPAQRANLVRQFCNGVNSVVGLLIVGKFGKPTMSCSYGPIGNARERFIQSMFVQVCCRYSFSLCSLLICFNVYRVAV